MKKVIAIIVAILFSFSCISLANAAEKIVITEDEILDVVELVLQDDSVEYDEDTFKVKIILKENKRRSSIVVADVFVKSSNYGKVVIAVFYQKNKNIAQYEAIAASISTGEGMNKYKKNKEEYIKKIKES